jgi:hypothetical protein
MSLSHTLPTPLRRPSYSPFLLPFPHPFADFAHPCSHSPLIPPSSAKGIFITKRSRQVHQYLKGVHPKKVGRAESSVLSPSGSFRHRKSSALDRRKFLADAAGLLLSACARRQIVSGRRAWTE